jgi:3-phenylpropionate/trans-cinnamate dioxygenase ferredoxin reductase subunit
MRCRGDRSAHRVIGASHAGSELAVRLRTLDPSTPVMLIGEEPELPYQRPPLSKGWLADPSGDVSSLLIRNQQAYDGAGVTSHRRARRGH